MNAPPSTPATETSAPPTLRTPRNRVSPRARGYWRVGEALTWLVAAVVVGIVWQVWADCPGWLKVLAVAGLVVQLVAIEAVPRFRYAVHRWEVDDVAVFTREGWLTRETRVAPLSRVQTVEMGQSWLQRRFGLASLTVTTASAAGPLTIEGLDADLAGQLVERLTVITAADPGDAT